MTERGEAGQTSEGDGQRWKAAELKIGVGTEEVAVVWIWSYILSHG